MNRIEWIDVAKGVSIVLVVFYHVLMFAELQGIPVSGLYAELNAPLRYIRMPLFFTVSALLLGSASGMSPPAFVTKWVLPSLWVLVVWNLIYAVIGDADFGLDELVTPYGHLWFLCALIAFRLAWLGLDRVRLPALAVAAGLSFWILWEPIAGMNLLARNVLAYAFFFLAAAWYGRPIAAWITRNQWLSFALGAVGTAISWKLSFRFGVSVAGVGMLWAASSLIARMRLPCDALRWLGRHSLEVFLIHYALLLPLVLAAAHLPGAAWLLPPVATVAAILIPIGLRRLTDPMAPWLYRVPRLKGRSMAVRP